MLKEDEHEERLLADVLRKDSFAGTRRPGRRPAELAGLVAGAWRSALGAPLARGARGVVLEAGASPEGDEVSGGRNPAGSPPRSRSWPRSEERNSSGCYVCADDLVFLVPLDALPHGGGRSGRSLELRQRGLLRAVDGVEKAPTPGEPGLSRPGRCGLRCRATRAGGRRRRIRHDPIASLPDRFARLASDRHPRPSRQGLLFEGPVRRRSPVVLSEGA